MNIHVPTQCPECKEINVIEMTEDQYDRYVNSSENVQNIFTKMLASKREMLITGICPKCWKHIFK